jgi:hypothetical protein
MTSNGQSAERWRSPLNRSFFVITLPKTSTSKEILKSREFAILSIKQERGKIKIAWGSLTTARRFRADSHIPCRFHAFPMPFPCRDPATTRPRPCHYPATILSLSWHSPTVPNAGRSPACRLWTADANSHIPCRSQPFPCRVPAMILSRPCREPAVTLPRTCREPAVTLPRTCREPVVALSGRFQNGIFVAWQGNGMGMAWHVWIKHDRTM